MQEGKVYRLRDHMETKEFTDSLGWLWIFLGYTDYRGWPSHARAKSVATGDIASFFPNAFEEVEGGADTCGQDAQRGP